MASLTGRLGLIAGLKFTPSFGGGFCPPYGPKGELTALFCTDVPTIVVLLPDSKKATYSLFPSGLTAIALGSSPARLSTTGAAVRFNGSKTISLLACAPVTNARCGVPANATSAGSSSVCSVATTLIVLRFTMLTLSEIWLTTHASVFVRARTETGSSPTGTEPRLTGIDEVLEMSKTSSLPSAVFTARSFLPSGVTSSGWTCGVSQLTKDAGLESVEFE